MGFDVVVVGPISQELTLSIDELPPTDGSASAIRMREAVGGKGVNAATACVRLGATVALVGAMGDDKLGKRGRKQIKNAGIKVRLVQHRPGQPTGRRVHLVEPDGHRRLVELGGANDSLSVDVVELTAALSSNGWLLMSTAMPVAPLIEAAQAAKAVGTRIALDLCGPPETSEALLRYADLVRIDGSDAVALTGTAVTDFDSAAVVARWLQVRGPDIVAVPAGADGDLLRFHTDELRVPLEPEGVVDPTGAGDAFIATLVVRLTAGDPPLRAAELAAAAATHTAGQLGGTPRFDVADLERLT